MYFMNVPSQYAFLKIILGTLHLSKKKGKGIILYSAVSSQLKYMKNYV